VLALLPIINLEKIFDAVSTFQLTLQLLLKFIKYSYVSFVNCSFIYRQYILLLNGSETFTSNNNNNNNNNNTVQCGLLACWLIRKASNYKVNTRPRMQKSYINTVKGKTVGKIIIIIIIIIINQVLFILWDNTSVH